MPLACGCEPSAICSLRSVGRSHAYARAAGDVLLPVETCRICTPRQAACPSSFNLASMSVLWTLIRLRFALLTQQPSMPPQKRVHAACCRTSWQAVSSLRSESVLRSREPVCLPCMNALFAGGVQRRCLASRAGTWQPLAAASPLLQACGPSPVSPADAHRGPWACMIRQCHSKGGPRGAVPSDHLHLRSSSVFAAPGHPPRPAFASCWTLRNCQRKV